MDPARRAFYAYHAALMEPWDGPASVVFRRDRGGRGSGPQRPASVTYLGDRRRSGRHGLGSRCAGPRPRRVVKRMRLQPGRMFLVDTAQGRIISDEEIKNTLAAEHPYAQWLESEQFHIDDLPQGP